MSFIITLDVIVELSTNCTIAKLYAYTLRGAPKRPSPMCNVTQLPLATRQHLGPLFHQQLSKVLVSIT